MRTAEKIQLLKNKVAPAMGLSEDELYKSTIVLFFGAEWHARTRLQLIPKLKKIYDSLKKRTDKNIEFIFISCDKTKEEYQSFTQGMPWPKLDYEDEDREKLIRIFLLKGHSLDRKNVGRPVVTTLNVQEQKCDVLCENATQRIMSTDEDGTGNRFPWYTSTRDSAEEACIAAGSFLFAQFREGSPPK